MNFCIYKIGHDTSHNVSKPMVMSEYKIRDDIKISLNANL
jgi:hypothetical protein